MRRTSPADSLAHWSKLLENLSASSKDFYASVETGLTQRKLPDADGSRVMHNESGLFSAKREYLLIQRGRHTMDICAAPFGTGFFVSWWLSRKRPSLLLALIVLVLVYLVLLLASVAFFDVIQTGNSFSVALARLFNASGPVLLQQLSSLPAQVMAWGLWWLILLAILRDTWIGEALCALPLIGPWWEHWICPTTYYRVDTYLMFLNAVHAAVLDVIDGLTTTQGLRLLGADERKPVMRDFFRR